MDESLFLSSDHSGEGSDDDSHDIERDDSEHASSDDDDAIYDTGDHPDPPPAPDNTADTFRVDHTRGEHRMKVPAFIQHIASKGFGGTQAIRMLQHAYTFDFGSRIEQSRPLKDNDDLIPAFHLDMIAIVGRPMRPIVHHSPRFFDNVTISFENWRAPYRAKHIEGGIGFDLRQRTFRIATGATREMWYIVMHPRLATSELEPSHARVEASVRHSALEERHARFLADYIKQVFLSDGLVGEGVEGSWRLDQKKRQNITFNKWASFQHRFMEGWDNHVVRHATEPFWAENKPAFHAYDYGANIELDVTEQLQALDKEQPLQAMVDDTLGDIADDEAMAPPSPTATTDLDDDQALYSVGLCDLRAELEAKFDLDNIWSISYALAVDLNCLDGDTAGTEHEELAARCMLGDRNAVAREFSGPRAWTFYPMAFSPVYGNFTSAQPPEFLQRHVLTVMRNNLNARNEGIDALNCGYFQAYSNVKRSIRHSPNDLLATKSLTTAVVALPESEFASHRVRTKHHRLREQMLGMSTPDDPDQSRPFAREAQRIQAAINAEDYAYRMEQVVSIHVAKLGRGRRTFPTILHPIFQLMRFYLREPHHYRHVLHTFIPDVYPGVLGAFSRLFDQALLELQAKHASVATTGGNIAIAEAASAFDRLGSYLFTGNPQVIGHTIFRHLGATDSLRYGGWPFVDPRLLDVQDDAARLDRSRWPRRKDGQPALLHPVVLDFYYGKPVGATRQSNVWLHDFRGIEVAGRGNATAVLVDIFGDMWIPHMSDVIRRAIERGRVKRLRSSARTAAEAEQVSQMVERWSVSPGRFSWMQYRQILPMLAEEGGTVSTVTKPRRDVAEELFDAVRADPEKARRRWAGPGAAWLSVLATIIRGTDEKVVGREQWIGAISSAMLECRIEAMPGASRGKLTSRVVVKLVGATPSQALLATRPGTLQRAAIEASESGKQRPVLRTIDFGCTFPFTRIPPLIDAGLRGQEEQFARGDHRIYEHYCTVRHTVEAMLEDPLCDLMFMLTLTLAASSVTPTVVKDRFDAGKKKDAGVFAANLVMRMLWYLKPDAFPWDKNDASPSLPVPEMTKKTEHKGVNNRMLVKLGWVRVLRGSRDNPRNADVTLADRMDLMQAYRELLRHRRTNAALFIEQVFKSRDVIWVERCSSIVREAPGV